MIYYTHLLEINFSVLGNIFKLNISDAFTYILGKQIRLKIKFKKYDFRICVELPQQYKFQI